MNNINQLCQQYTYAYFLISIESPPPDTYRLPSDFDVGRVSPKNHRTKKGLYSFGIGRKYYEKVYIKGKQPRDPQIPGPGTYVPKNYTIGTEGRNFNFQGRTQCFNGKFLFDWATNI